MKFRYCFILYFIIARAFVLSAQTNNDNTLYKLISALTTESNVINAKKQYEISIINNKYNYLQWWTPSLILTDDFIYPYKREAFNNMSTSNASSLSLSLPFPTGSALTLNGSYSLDRKLLDTSTLEKQNFGMSQTLSAKIGVRQSLNPWWAHSKNNPYKNIASIQNKIDKNIYNITIRNVLLNCLQDYIALRKIERNINQIKKTALFYDEIIDAYRQMQTAGTISEREYFKIRQDKWEKEQELFTLQNNLYSLTENLYKTTKINVSDISNDLLSDFDASLFTEIFLDIQPQAISSLEQINLNLQKNALKSEILIKNQSNAPALKIEFGSSFVLPPTSTDSFDSVWTKENFEDNINNNWMLSFSIDLSSLAFPINNKNRAQYVSEIKAIDNLSQNILEQTKNEKDIICLVINQLERQIEYLSVITENLMKKLKEDEILKDTGTITGLDLQLSEVEYNEKKTLLQNLNDDLWLYKLRAMFY